MWVLSQNKNILVNLKTANCIYKTKEVILKKVYWLIKVSDNSGRDTIIAKYSEEQKANKIINEIYDLLTECWETTFEMPADSEVK